MEKKMTLKKYSCLLLLILLLFPASGSSFDHSRDLVRIYTPDKADLLQVLTSGLDVVYSSPGAYVEILARDMDKNTILSLGLQYESVTHDIGRVRARINESTPIQYPLFADGSMGGFYTYNEALSIIDDLMTSDPWGIISSMETLTTGHDGNAVVMFKISDNVDVDEGEPEILYTSLHHAREPMGLMSLIYFVEHLLENYNTDPEVTYLVDNREMYFIPFVNPDGYRINEEHYFEEGKFGYWRKNTRDNNGNHRFDHFDGVDLNRNYGYMWGYDDVGSSPEPESGTYRGPYAFSEPETDAVRDFCRDHEFLLALNYHSYSNLMIYPWGFNDSETSDSLYYRELADNVTHDSNYQYGTGMETVGYRVNGDADDWMYGEQGEKPMILAMTPEIGNHYEGFWPPPGRIFPLALENLHGNLYLAKVAGAYLVIDGEVQIDDNQGNSNGFADPGETVDITVPVKNNGLTQTINSTTAGLISSSSMIDITGLPSDFGTIEHLGYGDNSSDPFRIILHDSIPNGERVWFYLDFTGDGGYVSRDSFDIFVGTPEIVFSDDAENGMDNFDSSGWGIDSAQVYAGYSSFSDSPGSDYQDDTVTHMTLRNGLDLGRDGKAYLTYQARWFIQKDWDIAKIQVSRDGIDWETLDGTNTFPGSGIVPHHSRFEEGYHSTQLYFKKETVDLSGYTGSGNESVLFRFTLTSGSWTEFDGIYVDDLEVLFYESN
jgi:hypothetical protein